MVNAIACTIELWCTREVAKHERSVRVANLPSASITHYNPPINFHAISLATLRHVLDSYHAKTPRPS